jgi:phosphoribosylamine-glycine ligase
MNVLVVGQGGREHALAWKLSKSKQVSKFLLLLEMVEQLMKQNVLTKA